MAELLVTVPKEARTTLLISSKPWCCYSLFPRAFYVGIRISGNTPLNSSSPSIPPMLGDLKTPNTDINTAHVRETRIKGDNHKPAV